MSSFWGLPLAPWLLLVWGGLTIALVASFVRRFDVLWGVGVAGCGLGVAAVGLGFIMANTFFVASDLSKLGMALYVHVVSVPAWAVLELGLAEYVPNPDYYLAGSLAYMLVALVCGARALRGRE